MLPCRVELEVRQVDAVGEISELHDYNYERTHQGKMCCGRTPMQKLIDGKEAWHDKIATLNN
jgi:hypothetical protein